MHITKGPVSIFSECGYRWFRIFGYGLMIKPSNIPVLFSERYGYRKFLKIGKWKFRILRPNNK